MPEFDFYFNDNEISRLATFIFCKNGVLIPDNNFESESYPEIKDVETLQTYLDDCFHYFLIDRSFISMPFLLRRIEKDNRACFYISQRWGGPYIDFMFFPKFAEDAPLPHKRSNISHYPRFILPSTREELKAPDSLKTYYSDILKYIKSQSKHIEHNGKKYWVGKETWAEISSNLQ
jgi:hypothetical protein